MNAADAQTEAMGYPALMPSVTDSLRNALNSCGQTRYEVSRATGIPQSTLFRFVIDRKPMRGENVDKLSEYLGLALVPKAKTKGQTRALR
jgi:hypothetical protein